VKKGVAKDGEQLLNGINVDVADKVKRVASSVRCCSGANTLDAPDKKVFEISFVEDDVVELIT
jgi:hypothetical protein